MLFAPVCELQSVGDNYGATFTEAGLGTGLTASATANTKGSVVSLLAGASVPFDVYGVGITFFGGSASATVRRYLTDIVIDPAGGTTWDTTNPICPNLLANSPALVCGGWRYFFPLYVKAGTSFGARTQCSAASAALRCAIQLYGQPTHPENWRTGTRVIAFGVNTATTSGTAVTVGSGAIGSYTLMGATARELWWWQWGGIASNDTTMGLDACMGDVATGDGTTFKLCVDSCMQNKTAAEQAGKEAFGLRVPIREVASGANVYVRVSNTSAGDTTPTTTAYGLG